MFDDLLSATALIGVASVLAASLASLATEPPSPTLVAATRGPPGTAPATGTTASAPGATPPMPVYDLPRVVVTGNRLRDGDMLADGRDQARRAGGPR